MNNNIACALKIVIPTPITYELQIIYGICLKVCLQTSTPILSSGIR